MFTSATLLTGVNLHYNIQKLPFQATHSLSFGDNIECHTSRVSRLSSTLIPFPCVQIISIDGFLNVLVVEVLNKHNASIAVSAIRVHQHTDERLFWNRTFYNSLANHKKFTSFKKFVNTFTYKFIEDCVNTLL